MRILIDNELKLFYMLQKKYCIMQTLKYIIVLNIKGNHNFKHFYDIHIVEIPNQKGEHSWICTELSLKPKDWIRIQTFLLIVTCTIVFPCTTTMYHTLFSSPYLHVIFQTRDTCLLDLAHKGGRGHVVTLSTFFTTHLGSVKLFCKNKTVLVKLLLQWWMTS